MRLIAISLLLAAAATLRAELIDRVAIAIGNRAITESQIDEELRVTAFLNHRPVVRDSEARHLAAERMIEQFLIEREIAESRFPVPDTKEVERYRAQVERDYHGAALLEGALRQYNLDAVVLRTHLAQQLIALRFISFRFQPEIGTSDHDVERRTDEALSAWLAEARKRIVIVYLDKALEK